jgi:coenzyme F420-0:L-glutamate ligase/coenzyme F420-1:gamma-L-glutamate ligase
MELRLFPVTGMPEVRPGDNLAALLDTALQAQGTPLAVGDVLVVTQKIVSKAEDRIVSLADVTPRPEAQAFGQEWDRDPRQVEVVLRESKRILRMERGVVIAETEHGWVCANAGVDASNVGGGDAVALLPVDSSTSATAIRRGLREAGQPDVAVLISDTFGRPWREGVVNVAIGVSGMNPMRDYIGQRDAEGYDLRMTVMATADEIAAAAELVMNKLDHVPAAVLRGLDIPIEEGDHRSLIRAHELDLFR